jgi:ribosomal-protein-alanine N-acetyltransferase
MIQEEEIIIEEMREDDLDEVLEIEEASFSDPWSYMMFKSELSNPISHPWVARSVSGMLAGYICFWIVETEAHVLNLAVHPMHRQKGIGSRLITASLNYWKRVGVENAYLEVRESNEVARRLYERIGFRLITRRPKYYRNPKEDAYVMGLELT